MKIELPRGAQTVLDTLAQNGYEAFVVGGCVRDSLLGREPNDWDITTSARPEQITACFPDHTLLLNGLKHGTVGIILDGKVYEATTYRVDGLYSDNRRPDSVMFTKNLRGDLARRDFTVNAMAYSGKTGIIDCFGGREDLENSLVRCVGDPEKRFQEDALRILRALRFSSKLGFQIEEQTAKAVKKQRELLKNIAAERIAQELVPLLCGKGAGEVLLGFCDVFAVFIPELTPMFGLDQNTPHHDLPLWEHTVKSVTQAAPQKELRLTMLLHDIGKPACKTTDENGVSHFHGHPGLSARMAGEILRRLRLPAALTDEVTKLILYHDYRCEPSARAVKRLLQKVGEDAAQKLVLVRYADANAQSPYKKEEKIKLIEAYRAELFRVLEQKECYCLKDMDINGKDLIEAGISPGREIGRVLSLLLDEVIDGKTENKNALLLKRAEELIL